MGEVRDDFGKSFEFLKSNKKVVLPVLFSTFFTFFLILLFLVSTGLFPVIREIFAVSAEFEGQKTDYLLNKDNIGAGNYTWNLFGYLSRDSARSPYNNEWMGYMDQKGFEWAKFGGLITLQNIVLLIIFILIWIIGCVYFSSMKYVMIMALIKKQKFPLSALLNASLRFFPRLFMLNILQLLLIIIPLVVIIGIVALLFAASKIIGALSVFLFILLFLAYLIYIGMGLLFTEPMIYLENAGAFSSIPMSFNAIKGRLKTAFLILVIISLVYYVNNSFIMQPLYNSYYTAILSPEALIVIANIILAGLFIVLHAFASTFSDVFLFHAYINLKKPLKPK